MFWLSARSSSGFSVSISDCKFYRISSGVAPSFFYWFKSSTSFSKISNSCYFSVSNFFYSYVSFSFSYNELNSASRSSISFCWAGSSGTVIGVIAPRSRRSAKGSASATTGGEGFASIVGSGSCCTWTFGLISIRIETILSRPALFNSRLALDPLFLFLPLTFLDAVY